MDRCVANLLYHKYTDSPGGTIGTPEAGQQQQNSEGTATVMQQQSSGLGGRGVKPSDDWAERSWPPRVRVIFVSTRDVTFFVATLPYEQLDVK